MSEKESSQDSLDGLYILICRPPSQVQKLRKKLEDRGARVQVFSPFMTQVLSPSVEVKKSLEEIESYQWLIFSSFRAVGALCELMEKGSVFLPRQNPPFRLAVVGKKTAQTLTEELSPLSPEVTAPRFSVLLEKLADKCSTPQRALHLTSQTSIEKLSHSLPSHWVLHQRAIYETVVNASHRPEKIKEIQREPFNCLLFSSPSSFDYFCQLVGREVPQRAELLMTMGPTTAEYIENRGLKVEIVPSRPEVNLLLEALERGWQKNLQKR